MLYPVVIFIVSRISNVKSCIGKKPAKISLIIAAHNEERVIRKKIKNCLDLNFGNFEKEIIIVSDGSCDNTNCILDEYAACGLTIIKYHPRQGKANALNIGFEKSSGDILMFSDANVMINNNAISKLAQPFIDQQVGATCARVFIKSKDSDEIAGESLYMKYEGFLQRSESDFWSMVGVDGALFALRRNLFKKLDKHIILDDFAVSMEAVLKNKRIVYISDATAVEYDIASSSNEFKRKSRIIAGGYQYLAWLLTNKKKLNLKVWFLFFSHKILRWLSFAFLIILFVSNVFVIENSLYFFFLLSQIFFYLVAIAAYKFPALRNIYFFYFPFYFCVINAAAMSGCYRFLFGKQSTLWEKVKR